MRAVIPNNTADTPRMSPFRSTTSVDVLHHCNSLDDAGRVSRASIVSSTRTSGRAKFLSCRPVVGGMTETPARTPTTDPERRSADDHGHDTVSPLQAAIITVSTSRATSDGDADDPGGDRIKSLFENGGHR